jgi:hypothetical protein
MKLMIIKHTSPYYRGKQATYNGEIVYPNGRQTVYAVVMTGGNHDT